MSWVHWCWSLSVGGLLFLAASCGAEELIKRAVQNSMATFDTPWLPGSLPVPCRILLLTRQSANNPTGSHWRGNSSDITWLKKSSISWPSLHAVVGQSFPRALSDENVSKPQKAYGTWGNLLFKSPLEGSSCRKIFKDKGSNRQICNHSPDFIYPLFFQKT